MSLHNAACGCGSPDCYQCGEPLDYTISVHRAIVRVPWRIRLRHWWARRRMTPAQRALAEVFDAKLHDEWLSGRLDDPGAL